MVNIWIIIKGAILVPIQTLEPTEDFSQNNVI